MSERPFMQLYVSDFVGDTLSLSTEHIGAYLLLLIALWNADGSLEDDADILATTTRLPLDRWLVVWSRLSKYFVVSGGRVTHNRLTRELEKFATKSAARAEAGSRGGKAKALKDKNPGLAIASSLPQHLPDTRKKDARARTGLTENLAVALTTESINRSQPGEDLVWTECERLMGKKAPSSGWSWSFPSNVVAQARENLKAARTAA